MERYEKLPNLHITSQTLLSQVERNGHSRQLDVVRPARVHKIERRLNAAVIAELVAQYKAGAHSTELAVQFDISKPAVLNLLRKHGVVIRRQPLTASEVKAAARLYEQGWSLARLGQKYDRHPSVFHLAFQRIGMTLRSPNERSQQS